VQGRIINGDQWISDRIATLRERLDSGAIDEDEREVLEAELDVLSKERGLGCGGPVGFSIPRRRISRRKQK
jgi:hypothetical protein